VNAGEEISGQLVVTGRDSAEMLEFVEEALDEIALAIKGKIAGQRRCTAGMRRNHRSDLPLGEDVDEGIGVVCLVAKQSRWIGIGEQWLCADKIVGLSWRKHQLDGIAQRIDERVNFGAQSAARSTDRLRAVFFRAPALC
jgi:hypothetical protein